jgi:hypothetical protein
MHELWAKILIQINNAPSMAMWSGGCSADRERGLGNVKLVPGMPVEA